MDRNLEIGPGADQVLKTRPKADKNLEKSDVTIVMAPPVTIFKRCLL